MPTHADTTEESMTLSIQTLVPELMAPLVDPAGDAHAVAAHLRAYIEARAALRALPLRERANALLLPAGGHK